MKRLTVSTQTCVEILGLLVDMAWADGRLEESEREGVRGSTKVLNLSKAQRDQVDEMLKEPRPFDELLLDRLAPKDRAFAFVAAAWMAGADHDVSEKEQAFLDRLATRFGFAHERRDELVQLARDLEPPAKAHRKWADELVRLFKAIPPRLLEEHFDGDVEIVDE